MPMTARMVRPALEAGRLELRDLVLLAEGQQLVPAARQGRAGRFAELALAPAVDEVLEGVDARRSDRPRPARAGRRAPPRRRRNTGRSPGRGSATGGRRPRAAPGPRETSRSRGSACASSPAGTAGRCWARPSSSTLGRKVLPRVSTDRFCMTMASASEHMISREGMEALTRLTMSVSAKTPHLAATWCSLESSKRSRAASSAGMPTLMKHLSMVAPVPEAHLSFIEAIEVLPVSSPCLVARLLEDDDLGVLAAELDHRADVGVQLLDGERDRVDLLDELGAQGGGQRSGPRAGDEGADLAGVQVGKGVANLHQHLQHLLRLASLVALVVRPQDRLADRVDDRGLDGGRSHVDADADRVRSEIGLARGCSHRGRGLVHNRHPGWNAAEYRGRSTTIGLAPPGVKRLSRRTLRGFRTSREASRPTSWATPHADSPQNPISSWATPHANGTRRFQLRRSRYFFGTRWRAGMRSWRGKHGAPVP